MASAHIIDEVTGPAKDADSIKSRPAIGIVYPYIPHYRKAVFDHLLRSNNFSYRIYFSANVADTTIRSIDAYANAVRLPTVGWGLLSFQFGLVREIMVGANVAYIFLGNPYIASTWLYAAIARLRGRRVLFWTHGWRNGAPNARERLRNLFYKLAHGLLLYGRRAEMIGKSMGFSPSSLHVIYNSLDYEQQRKVRLRLERETKKRPSRLYFLCIARLTRTVRLDLAITALRILREKDRLQVPLVLIGDGPARDELVALAKTEGVEVSFLGELYDEEVIGEQIFHARAVVSPGKVGLTAMHALAYGVPVITHDRFAAQMPEFEAIAPGKTGDFFEAGNAHALALMLGKWVKIPRSRAERDAAVAIIEAKYTPERQVEAIECALARHLRATA